jgi:tRNA pseudouridine55 synthase
LPGIAGFIVIDKPAGITSHDVVAAVRRRMRQAGLRAKVGHTGTLDPLATGVLVLALHYATRLSSWVMAGQKTYLAELRFGEETDTGDADGVVTGTFPTAHLHREAIEAALPVFVGLIDQVPPMVSAVRVDGQRLYQLARAGVEVAREARQVRIDRVDIVGWQPPDLILRVVCGPGTYIRSLAVDLGRALGSGAHITALRRERSGDFDQSNATRLDDLLNDEDWQERILPPVTAVRDWPMVVLDTAHLEAVSYGRALVGALFDGNDTEHLAGVTEEGDLVALLRREGGGWQPFAVFHDAIPGQGNGT